jgi:F0F1-type ATP synthase delta subunit
LDLVKKMASKAGELRAVSSKSTDATVTSAVPLSKEQQATLAKALPAYAPAGTSLNVNFTVDPAVLGGLLVSIRNTTIDLTATSRLVDVVAGSRAQLH